MRQLWPITHWSESAPSRDWLRQDEIIIGEAQALPPGKNLANSLPGRMEAKGQENGKEYDPSI